MAPLEELLSQRTELTKHRNSGQRAVQFGERRVEFKSDAEMQAAIAALDRDIAALQGRPAITTVRITSSKGL